MTKADQLTWSRLILGPGVFTLILIGGTTHVPGTWNLWWIAALLGTILGDVTDACVQDPGHRPTAYVLTEQQNAASSISAQAQQHLSQLLLSIAGYAGHTQNLPWHDVKIDIVKSSGATPVTGGYTAELQRRAFGAAHPYADAAYGLRHFDTQHHGDQHVGVHITAQ